MGKKIKFIAVLIFYSFRLFANLFANTVTFQSSTIDVLKLLRDTGTGQDFVIGERLGLRENTIPLPDIIFHIDCKGLKTRNYDASGNYVLAGKDVTEFLIPVSGDSLSWKNPVCLFQERNNTLLLETTPARWPYRDSSSFSLSFWLHPFTEMKNQILMEWSSFAGEEKKIFRIYLDGENLNLKLENVFPGIKLDIPLTRILPKEWNHVFLSFGPEQKQILAFLNGKLKKIFYLPPQATSPDFTSPDLPPIVIGKNYTGYMDEIYLLRGFYSEPVTYRKFSPLAILPHSGRLTENPKELHTPIIPVSPRTYKLTVLTKQEKPAGTFLKIQYRFLENPAENATWKTLPAGTNVSFARKEIKPYLQFRILMRQDAEGIHSPVISRFLVEETKIQTLPKITHFRVVKELSDENQVCLEWQKLPEEIIEEHGGYALHIGIQPDTSILMMTETPDGNPIKKQFTDFPLTEEEKEIQRVRPSYIRLLKRNFIRIIITKEDILRYQEKLISGSPFQKRLKLLLEPDALYYFRVSAYVYDPHFHGPLSVAVSHEF